MSRHRTPWLTTGSLVVAACGSSHERPPDPVPAPIDAARPRPRPDALTATGNLASRTSGMVLVPAGPYDSCDSPPPCQVDVPEFYIDRLEVTVADYRRCVDARRCEPPVVGGDCTPEQINWGHPDREQHPINCIREVDAGAYCHFRGVHLPTEWQREKATRGPDDPRRYPWGDAPPTCKLAVIARSDNAMPGCDRGSSWPVGSRAAGASPYGILDLAGNIAEYTTIDWDPVDPSDAGWLQISTGREGGSFRSVPSSAGLLGGRGGMGEGGDDTGFRCAFQPSASLDRRR